MANVLAQRIEDTLRPVLGTVLSSVSVDVEARRIGKTTDTIDRSDLPRISENLVNALKLVVGQEMASVAGRKVRELV